ncbi:MAG: glycine oxidase [Bermanella sp.]|jgi:glycine oxidase
MADSASGAITVGIAGGGLIGRLMAWQLLRRGHQVTVFDRGPASGEHSAAFVAAAMLAPYSEAVTSGAEMFELGKRSAQLWPSLLAELREDSELPVALQTHGSLVIAHDLDSGSFTHFDQKLHAVVGDDVQVQSLNREGIQRLEPELPASFRRGVWLSGEGSLDNRALLAALYESIVARGGHWRAHCEVLKMSSGAVQLTDASEHFDWVIDCRGTGAKIDWPEVRGVRGEILWVKAPAVQLTRPIRLMHPRYNLYITPKPNKVFVVGATEIESESQAPVTVRSELELLSALYSVHSGFAEAHIVGSYARCRPALPDNLPAIRASKGMLRINGLYRHGYLLAPAVLAAALDAMDGRFQHDFVTVVEQDDSDQREQRA